MRRRVSGSRAETKGGVCQDLCLPVFCFKTVIFIKCSRPVVDVIKLFLEEI